MIDTAKYIRIPYHAGGRSFDGCDCFGLAILIHSQEYGREIKDVLYPSEPDVARLIDENQATIGAAEIETPQEGDLVLMREGREPAHIGVYIDRNMVIHTSRRYGTCCESADGPRLRAKIIGYYRVG